MEHSIDAESPEPHNSDFAAELNLIIPNDKNMHESESPAFVRHHSKVDEMLEQLRK